MLTRLILKRGKYVLLLVIVLQVILFYNNIVVKEKANKISVSNAKLTLEIVR